MRNASVLLSGARLSLTFGTVANVVGGVAGLINNILGPRLLLDVEITCPELSFKSKVVALNSLCQQVDNIEAIETCRNLVAECSSRPGTWGCGTFDITKERGCLFSPTLKYPGERLPSITFDRGVEDFDQTRSRNQCAFGRRTSRPPRTLVLQGEDSEPDVPYKDLSDMYGQALVANLKRFNASWIPEEEEMMASNDPVLALTVVLKALDVAGIRYPIGRYTCQFCKALATSFSMVLTWTPSNSRRVSGFWVDTRAPKRTHRAI